jgi:phosphoglycolate phosphatase-like HAD superfamily hydrolase
MKLEHVEGIIWDLDGTLLDSFGVFESIIADVIVDSGHAMPSRQHMIENYHGSLRETIKAMLDIDSDDVLNIAEKIFKEKQVRHYDSDISNSLFEDAINLAKRAGSLGINQLIVSNRAHTGSGNASPKAIVAGTVLVDYIHEVRTHDEVEYPKPDKRAIGDWLDRHDLDPSNVIVIGDQHVDAELAINIGARAIFIKRDGQAPHLNKLSNPAAVLVVDSLDEVEL